MTNNQLAENSVIQLLNSVKLARDNAERADNRVDHSFYYALTIALEELQERRRADTEPYGFTDGDRRGMIYKPEHSDRLSEPVPVYRHAQPAPVVQCPFPCGWDNLNKLAIQDAALVARGLVEGELTTEAHRQAAISNNDRLLKVISACRAAMLAAAQHDTPPPLSTRYIASIVLLVNGFR